jgi:Protein of unknown function (DUF1643)
MVGDGNDDAILAAAQVADRMIAAWGTGPHARDTRPAQVFNLLSTIGHPVEALDLTRHGETTRAHWDATPVPYAGPAKRRRAALSLTPPIQAGMTEGC